MAAQLRGHPTIEQAVEYFFKSAEKDGAKGHNTTGKYEKLLKRRLLPWCNQQRTPIRLVSAFDDPITVREFYHSWRKRKIGSGGAVYEVNKELASSTKRADMERYRSFLEFCKDYGWIKANHAKKIKVGTQDIAQKIPFTDEEYKKLLVTLEDWRDEYGRPGSPKAIMQRVFCLCLRYTGQRISDVSMLGPDNIIFENGQWFIALTQIKTGSFVKVPLTDDLRRQLHTLPLRGETERPFTLKTKRRSIQYGTKFWFWTANCDLDDSGAAWQHISYNGNQWSEDISRAVRRCGEQFGRFKHKATAHTFRHYFAVSMLSKSVPIEMIAKWLGHASPLITAKHYSHANSDFYKASHDAYMKAIETEDQPKLAGSSKLKVMTKAS